MSTTSPPEVERKKDMVTDGVFIEILCVFLTVAGVNMKLVDCRTKKERLTHYKLVFQYQVENKWETKEWVDQHDVTEDKKTPDQSIQKRVHHIKTDTQETVISSMYDTITKLPLNFCLCHLRTILDSNDPIHSGQVEEDVFWSSRRGRYYGFIHKSLLIHNMIFFIPTQL
jgi:hypothetical protein